MQSWFFGLSLLETGLFWFIALQWWCVQSMSVSICRDGPGLGALHRFIGLIGRFLLWPVFWASVVCFVLGQT
jgi:hypothetical protein